MGELLRSVFGSPQQAQQLLDPASVSSAYKAPAEKYEVATLNNPVASIEKWLATAYNEGIIINDDWVVRQARERGPLIYDDMLDHDPHVFACFESLSGGAAKTPFEIQPANDTGMAKEHAEFIRSCFEHFDLVSALVEIARGEAIGFSVCEVVYEKFAFRGKSYLNVRSHKGQPGVIRIDSSCIVFDYLGQARVITQKDPQKGALLGPFQRYITYKRGSGPYGDALLKPAFQPYWFKGKGNMFLAKYIEMFGVPPIAAYHRNKEEMAKNLEMLKEFRSGAYASFPDRPSGNGEPITVVQPSKGGDNTIGSSLDFYNDEISKAILGGTRTMSRSQDAGAYSATEIHNDSLDDRRDNIVRRLAFVLNQQLIPSLIRINYGIQPAYPRANYGMDDQETPNDYMERVGIWAEKRVPAPISKSEFYQKSGFAEPKDDNDKLFAGQAPTRA